jgi:hypothetical protein
MLQYVGASRTPRRYVSGPSPAEARTSVNISEREKNAQAAQVRRRRGTAGHSGYQKIVSGPNDARTLLRSAIYGPDADLSGGDRYSTRQAGTT